MTQASQPRFLYDWYPDSNRSSAVTCFDGQPGRGDRLAAIAWPSCRAAGRDPAPLAALSCSAWPTGVLVEDFGFLGGLGTDPNSMIPMALLAVGGWLALTRGGASDRGRAPGRRDSYAAAAAGAGSGPAADRIRRTGYGGTGRRGTG